MDKVCGCAILSLRAEVTACAGPGTAHTGLDRQGLRLDLSPLDIALLRLLQGVDDDRRQVHVASDYVTTRACACSVVGYLQGQGQ